MGYTTYKRIRLDYTEEKEEKYMDEIMLSETIYIWGGDRLFITHWIHRETSFDVRMLGRFLEKKGYMACANL